MVFDASAIPMMTGGLRPVVCCGHTVAAVGRMVPADPARPAVRRPRPIPGNPAVVWNPIGPRAALARQCRCLAAEWDRPSTAFSRVCASRCPPGRHAARTMVGADAQTQGAPVGVDCAPIRAAAGGTA